MNDVYYELIVEKKKGSRERLIQIFSYSAGILLLFLTFVSPVFFPALLIYAALAYVFILPLSEVEYEYSVLNSELSVDAIYKKSKRKKLLNTDMKEAKLFTSVKSPELSSFHDIKIYDYTSGSSPDSAYMLVTNIDNRTSGILLEPDGHMLSIIEQRIPRAFKRA